MELKRPGLIVAEKHTALPLLIVDKEGTVGSALAEVLQEHSLVVFVSASAPKVSNNILHIPYHRRVPLIPDNAYAGMVVFYTGDDTVLDFLPAMLKKAHVLRSKIVFVTPLALATEQLFQKLSKHQFHDMQVVVYGELFYQQDMVDNPVNYFLHQAKAHGRITLSDNGIGKLYPIALADALSGITSLLFSEEKKKLVYLFPKTPISELSIARILQKNDPLVKIGFKKRKQKESNYVITSEGEYFFKEYPFEERLDALFASYHIQEDLARGQNDFWNTTKPIPFIAFVGAVLVALFLPILFFLTSAGIGAGMLFLSVKALEEGNFTQAKQLAMVSRESFAFTQTMSKGLVYVDLVAKQPKQAFLQQVKVGEKLSLTELEIVTGMMLMQEIFEGKSSDSRQDFLQSLALMKHAITTLQTLQTEGVLPPEISKKLTTISPVVTRLLGVSGTLPNILGFEGKRTYLVLFQNNMELRPGGGFIGSYALLQVQDGRILNFDIYDVYDADGKLKTHIEPPFHLRRYLGASHLFLRDSNYSIDFPTNAKRAADLLQLETGQRVDGVVAVDTQILHAMLSVLGPVSIPDYQETATAENVYLLTQTHVEEGFFPGSTQKKDFLRALLNAIFAKFAGENGEKKLATVQEIGELVQGKHILFAFSESAEQHVFTVNNASSALWDGRKKEKGSFLDFFGIIDTNIGTNKTNYYLTRTLEQRVSFDAKGTLFTTATVTYTNASTNDSPFGGDYKNYLRFVIPQGATLQEIHIDGQKVKTTDAIIDPSVFTAKRFIAPKALEIEKAEEQGRAVVGFFVEVPIGKSTTVAMTYSFPKSFDAADTSFTYDLKVFKQPGTLDDPYSLFITIPKGYKLVTASSGISDVGGKLAYSTYLTQDKHIMAVFSKK